MNVHERLNVFVHQMTPETPFCANCKNYYPHYIKESYNGRYEPIFAGHCVYPRMKARRAYDTCEHFRNRCKEKEADDADQRTVV